MQTLTVAIAQTAPRSFDVEANLATLESHARQAAGRGAHILVAPELADVGYVRWPGSRADLLEVIPYLESAAASWPKRLGSLCRIAKESQIALCVGLLEPHPELQGLYANASYLIDHNGTVLNVHRKLVLPLAEKFYFYPGDDLRPGRLGDVVVGQLICYDLLFPEHTRLLALRGCQAILANLNVPAHTAAAPGGYSQKEVDAVARTRAMENGVFLVMCNRVGTNEFGATRFAGGSRVIDPWGRVLVEAGDSEELLVAELDLNEVGKARILRPFLRDRRPDLYGELAASHRRPPMAGSLFTHRKAAEENRIGSGEPPAETASSAAAQGGR